MQKFTGIQYMMIGIANAFGLDKWEWQRRLDWAKEFLGMLPNDAVLKAYMAEADEPMMFNKLVRHYFDALQGKPTGCMVGLDATSSGPQLLGVMTACRKTCEHTNLIYNGKRNDVYTMGATYMTGVVGHEVSRGEIKDPLMTTFYFSTEQPKMLFGDDTPELAAFLQMLRDELTGAYEAMFDIASCWNPNALKHEWVLPDGHTASINVMVECDKRIEIDELDHKKFTHRTYVNEATTYNRSIPANVTHSVDAYVAREMVRRAKDQGFHLLVIHDSFWCHPNYCNDVRQNYNDILAEICEMDLLSDILSQITGEPLEVVPLSDRKALAAEIRNAEYSLS